MCLTIGGVYATWTYSGTDDIADSFAEAKVTIADVKLDGSNGTYKIETNLVLTVDQANEDHEAELVFGSNNTEPIHLTITFTPSASAPKEIKEGAVPSELYFGTTVPMQYRIDADGNFAVDGTPTNIFKFKNEGDGSFVENVIWTPNADGSFTCSLDEDALKQEIQLSRTFVLDTKKEHDVFGGHIAVDPDTDPDLKEGLIGF